MRGTVSVALWEMHCLSSKIYETERHLLNLPLAASEGVTDLAQEERRITARQKKRILIFIGLLSAKLSTRILISKERAEFYPLVNLRIG